MRTTKILVTVKHPSVLPCPCCKKGKRAITPKRILKKIEENVRGWHSKLMPDEEMPEVKYELLPIRGGLERSAAKKKKVKS